MPTLTTIGNGAIQGSGTTLSNADVDKSASGDTLIIFDNSASQFKRVSAFWSRWWFFSWRNIWWTRRHHSCT